MKGYVFTYGVDGFGADVAPANDEGCYLNFEKAFAHLVELNHTEIGSRTFYESGYGEDYYPSNDKELCQAEEEENWELFEILMDDHIITDEIEINKTFINVEPRYGMYAIEEIEIIED